jgi:hypothetical protein
MSVPPTALGTDASSLAPHKHKRNNRAPMTRLPIAFHADVSSTMRATIERIVGEHHTLERVLEWCQAQHPPQWIEAIVAQDEFTSDVIVRFDQQLYFVYDTT